ncbi:MAG: hypothetical protein ABIA75_11330 [Candidatus Neomarinimicrobiota bacterium]
MEFELAVPPDFLFYQTLQDTTRQPFGLSECLREKTYFSIIYGAPVAIIHNSRRSVLEVTTTDSTPAGPLRELLTRRFGLNQDLDSFYRHFDADPVLSPVIRRLTGLRVFQKDNRFEALVTAIIDQQVNLAFAATLKTRLIREFGQCQIVDGMELFEFPRPGALAALEELALRPLQFTGNKSRFIILLARAITDGSLNPDNWETFTDYDLLTALQSVYGVGRWTAEYVALISFNRLNMFPAADIGLLNVLQKIYGLEQRPKEQEARQMSQLWEPYRGILTFYLWYAYEQNIV